MRHEAGTFASLYYARLVFVAESPFAAMYSESRDMLLKIVDCVTPRVLLENLGIIASSLCTSELAY